MPRPNGWRRSAVRLLRGLSRMLGAPGYAGSDLAVNNQGPGVRRPRAPTAPGPCSRRSRRRISRLTPVEHHPQYIEWQPGRAPPAPRRRALPVPHAGHLRARAPRRRRRPHRRQRRRRGPAGDRDLRLRAAAQPRQVRPGGQPRGDRTARHHLRRQAHRLGEVMTVTIPKTLRSAEFTELTLVDLNDVDVDRQLAHLWELIVKQGRMAKAPPTTPMTTTTTGAPSPPTLALTGSTTSTAEGPRRVAEVVHRADRREGARPPRNADGLHPAADDRQLPGGPAQDPAAPPRTHAHLPRAHRRAEAARRRQAGLEPAAAYSRPRSARGIDRRDGELDPGVRRQDRHRHQRAAVAVLPRAVPAAGRTPGDQLRVPQQRGPGGHPGPGQRPARLPGLLRQRAERVRVRRRVRRAAVAAAVPAAAADRARRASRDHHRGEVTGHARRRGPQSA